MVWVDRITLFMMGMIISTQLIPGVMHLLIMWICLVTVSAVSFARGIKNV
jgi:hypothetical protein